MTRPRHPVKIVVRILLVLFSVEAALWLTGRIGLSVFEYRLRLDSGRSSGLFRILFLGESTMQGSSLMEPRRDRFSSLVQYRINAMPTVRPTHCINLGFAGMGSGLMLARLKMNLLFYEPQIVVIQAGNNAEMGNLASYIHLLGTESRISRETLKSILTLFQNLRTVRFINTVLDVVLNANTDDFRRKHQRYLNSAHFNRLHVEINVANIGKMIDLVRGSGARVVLCNYFESGANEFLDEIKADKNVVFCDNRDVYQASLRNPGGSDLISVDGWHPNEKGHRLIAENLYQTMLDAGYLADVLKK
ncbi:MAG TPA: SGNH/GDSL hydrolase family protein [Elusimicrobiota bacterium]|nr:SGNH/GDSL hydrolase family protein [Elusimicrobiota bacterium]